MCNADTPTATTAGSERKISTRCGANIHSSEANATVTLTITDNAGVVQTFTTTTDGSGNYALDLGTQAGAQPLAIGTYTAVATVPMSALKGWNVVSARADEANWAGYTGPALLELLERLPVTADTAEAALAYPVQWVEAPQSGDNDTAQIHLKHRADVLPVSRGYLHLFRQM